MTESSIIAVNHVGISVADLARSRAFWTDALGALDHGGFGWPVGTTPADESLALRDTAAEVAILRSATAFLELFAFSSPRPEPRSTDAPGIAALTWAVTDVDEAHRRALDHGGSETGGDLRCPDGTPITLVRATSADRTGLVGVTLRVPDPTSLGIGEVPGPVRLDVVPGGDAEVARPVDLGANHVCLDVADAVRVREEMAETRWHHDVTESSGGLAAVCYGTTRDGVLVELLEARGAEAWLSRSRLTSGVADAG